MIIDWLVDNKFIFKSQFNCSIDVYVVVISMCDELIFFNYNNIEIKANNEGIFNLKQKGIKIKKF